MKETVNICIVHYNTPLLTECLVKSINKFTPNSKIYIFDNSDKDPFVYRQDNIIYLDNTKGQIINFDEWLKKYPNRFNKGGASVNNFGSAKHCYSVEKCMELIDENFILLDSDVLLRQDISILNDPKYVYCGEVVTQPNSIVKRVLPFVCFINVDFCKRNKIHYFNHNRMHGLCKTDVVKNGNNYDTGANFYTECEKYQHKNIKHDNYVIHYGCGSWRAGAKKVESFKLRKIKDVCPELWLEENKKLWSGEKNKKVIYTCITGNYDQLEEPQHIADDFDYVCFSDSLISSNIWQIRPIPFELDGLNDIKKQRNIKINPHKYLSEYDFSIWVDGNITLKGDVNDYIKKECNDNDISVFIPKHPKRNCIYEEAKAVISMRKDTKENVNTQINDYEKNGFPKKYGLPQSGIIFRFHNNEDCIKLMDTWWEEVEKYSHRDQLSFSYALWKNQDVKIKYLNESIFDCEYFKWGRGHKKSTAQKSYNSTNTPKVEFVDVRKPLNKKPADRVIVKSYFSRKP